MRRCGRSASGARRFGRGELGTGLAQGAIDGIQNRRNAAGHIGGGVALMLPDHRPASGLHGGRLLPLPLLLHLHDARFLRPDPLLQGLHVQAGAHFGLACRIQRGQQSITG